MKKAGPPINLRSTSRSLDPVKGRGNQDCKGETYLNGFNYVVMLVGLMKAKRCRMRSSRSGRA